jgi:hypothetical protein
MIEAAAEAHAAGVLECDPAPDAAAGSRHEAARVAPSGGQETPVPPWPQ